MHRLIRKSPSLIFVDNLGLQFLRSCLPQIQVFSQKFEFQRSVHGSRFGSNVFDALNNSYLPLPASAFTRHHLHSKVASSLQQPFLLEAGYLSVGNHILVERNPVNKDIPSLFRLKRRALPGLRFPCWPWSGEQKAWRQIPGGLRSNQTPKFLEVSGFVFTSFNNPNWYHWLTMPGLGSFPPAVEPNEIFLCDRDVFACKTYAPNLLARVASLASALYPRSKISLEQGPLLIQELETCFIENHTPLVCDPVGLNKLRIAAHSLIANFHHRSHSNLIYLRRGPNCRRPLLAEEKLENDLRKLGFTVIEAAELQLDQCISIFARARWVVAPHGAALANLIFASPGTRVLELLPGSLDKYGHYALMSAALDIQHNIWHRHGKSSDRFEIDQARMLAWLSAQVSEY
jgi:hypothetical protein